MVNKGARRLLQTADWAFIVVVAAAYISLFTAAEFAFTPTRIFVLVSLGTLYTVIGTYLFETYIFSAPLRVRILYFVFQLPLATAIALLGEFAGAFWLLLLPLVSHSAVLFDRGGMFAISVTTMLIFGLLIGIPNGWQVGLTASLSFAPGVVFVLIFTQMAMNESRARTQVERLAHDLAEAHEALARYAVQAEELATAKERNRLAREIHDSLGHYLTAINMQLEAARAVLHEEDTAAAPLLERAQVLTKEGLREVRRSVAALRASPLEGKSLPASLAALVEALQASGIAATFTVIGEARALSPQAELALYRVGQEALTNVRKHAQAHHAAITLTYAPDSVRLSVQDDGVGHVSIDNGNAAPSSGFGLVGLRERVQLLGGELTTTSAPEQGFTLDVVLHES